ncbi:hypothetical protein [Streptomyces sp. NPDC047065]|uniref:hypothetical protein n=1 Tax=Streptomyces sp. NPDC047065 TaxID=3154606 RepID=UPI0033E6B71F
MIKSLRARLGLRLAGRRAVLAGLLMMLAVPVAGGAQAEPALAPAAMTAPMDPCEQLPEGSAAYTYCKEGDGGGATDAKPAKDDPCAALKGTPGYDFCTREPGSGGDPSEQGEGALDTITGDCKAAPEVESPGQGIIGWIDSGPDKAPGARSPSAAGADAYLYEQYGFAGLRWSTYDLGCGGSLRDPMAATDTWWANRVFTWSKSWTALTVVLRQYATSDKLYGSLDPVVERATQAVRDAVYSPWIGTSLLLLGTVIIYQARRKNLPDVASQIAWALLVMTVATGVARYPVEASQMADKAINSTVAAIDQGFAGVSVSDSSTNQSSSTGTSSVTPAQYPGDQTGDGAYSLTGDRAQDTTAHGNMLVHSVLYQQWLRGELGDDDSDVAKKYGVRLFDAQALTWRENRLPSAERAKVIDAKKKTFQEIAGKIEKEDPTAYAHLTGKEDGRLGAATISNVQALASNSFSFAGDLVIIGGKLMIKFLVILFPALAVIGLHRRSKGAVKTAFSGAMAAAINVPLFAAGSAVDVLVVREISDPRVDIPTWLKVVVMLLVSYVLWKTLRPLTRLSAMVNPNHNYLGDAGSAFTSPGRMAQKYAKYYLGSRYLRKLMRGQQGQADTDEADTDVEDARGGYRPGGASRPDTDSGYWADTDSWPYADNGTAPGTPPGPEGPGGGSGALSPAAEQGTDYWEPYERQPLFTPAGALAGGNGTPAAGGANDVWDAESWYVEGDLPAASSAGPALAAGRSQNGQSSTGRNSGSLPAAPAPEGPAPLPGGNSGGARADVPLPRAGAGHRSGANGSHGGTGQSGLPPAASRDDHDLPGGPVPRVPGASTAPGPEGDRPYATPEESGPRVVPPTPTDDGVVYQIFTPGEGFSIQDEREGLDDDGGMDGGER